MNADIFVNVVRGQNNIYEIYRINKVNKRTGNLDFLLYLFDCIGKRS